MSSSEPATLSLRARSSLTELTISDLDYRTVARGVGILEEELPPGIYQVEWRAGPAVESKLVDLRPGKGHDEHDLEIAIPAVAPVAGTSTTAPEHEAAAMRACEQLGVPQGCAGLVVMLRRPREVDGAAPESGPKPVALRPLGGDLQPLKWSVDLYSRWAIATAAVPAGGYALRAPRSGLPAHVPQELEQSLWLAQGFKTLMFVPWASERMDFARASVHMVRADRGWGADAPAATAVEQLLWSLQAGDAPLSVAAAVDLLAEHPEPMGDLLAAHLELLRRRPEADRLAELVRRLEAAVPGHPDLVALQWIARARGLLPTSPALSPASLRWPPMLRAGYEGATRVDGEGAGVFRDGSPAVRVCARIFIEGVWTAWHPTADAEPPIDQAAEGGVLQDPATRRIERYLRRGRATTGIGTVAVPDSETTHDIAYHAALPAAAVARALTDLEAVAPRPAAEPDADAAAEEPPYRRAPAPDQPLTNWERLLRWVLQAAATLFALTAVASLAIVPAAGPDAAAAIGAVAAIRSTVLAVLCRYAGADVRRRGAIVELTAAVLVLEALVIGVVLPDALDVQTVTLLGVTADVSQLTDAIGTADVLLALALHFSYSLSYARRWNLEALTPGNHRTIVAIAELLQLPNAPISPEDAALNADAYLARMRRVQRITTRLALWAVSLWPLLRLGPPFPSLTPEERRGVIHRQFLRDQRFAILNPPLRSCLRIAHQVASLGYYSDLRVWRAIGAKSDDRRAPQALRRQQPALATRARPREGERLTVDAVVAGSGAAGAVIAYRLAERGMRTLIVERAGRLEPTGAPDSEFRSFPELFVEDSYSIVREFDMRVVQSASLGGETGRAAPVWSEASLQTLERWNGSELDAGIDVARFERALRQVETWLPGAGRPAGELSAGVDHFLVGARRMGLDVQRPPDAAPEAGAPPEDLSAHSAAVLDTLIPWGQRRFGERLGVLPSCRAVKLLIEDGNVAGLGCLAGGKKLEVAASTVVLAAGAIHSSDILRNSGLKRNVGRRLSFDLSSSMTAAFAEPIDAFGGVQLATDVELGDLRFVAETSWQDPAAQALTMPGWFSQHAENMRLYRNMTAVRVHFGVDRTGDDLLVPFRRPSANIHLEKKELRDLLKLLRVAGDVLLAAGARRVMPQTLIYRVYESPSELAGLTEDVRSSREIAVTARPQGGNPISRTPERGVVGPSLAVHGHPNVLVCDASVFPSTVLRNPRLVAMALAEYAAAGLD